MLYEVITEVETESLEKLVGTEVPVIIDGESDEHEFLLSARALNWAPDIDGEIYINDNEREEALEFGVIYTARITERAGNRVLGCVIA